MSQFTYEKKESDNKLETFEWDNTWIEQTAKSDARRVLYVGDSISCGTRRIATERSGGKVLFDGFGTSKAVDNPYFCESVGLFARQVPYIDAVIFNNGLHGWHLEDTGDYLTHYDAMISFLLSEFPDTPVYIVLTTAITDPWDCRVKVRNESAIKVAQKYRLPVIDLYAPIDANRHLVTPDKIHLTDDGYKLIARKILDTLSTRLHASTKGR